VGTQVTCVRVHENGTYMYGGVPVSTLYVPPQARPFPLRSSIDSLTTTTS